jgi:hypothetical protein
MKIEKFYLDGTHTDYNDSKERWISIGHNHLWLVSIASRGLLQFECLPHSTGYDIHNGRLKIIGVDLI